MSQTEVEVVTRDRDDAIAGVRAMAPMLLVYAPFGLLVGAAVARSESPTVAWLSTWTVYGGAAHLAVLDVLQQGTGALGAAVVGLLINARMIAYAASLAPHWRDGSTRSRVAAAAILTDATWGLAQSHPAEDASARRRFYFGAGLVLWFGWPLLVTLGVLVGGWVQDVPVATLLPCLTLGSLAVRQLRTRPTLAAGAAAAAVAVATAGLDGGVALLLAAAVGATAAAVVHRRAS
jgi:predicted branched-subunit amino acid permease